MQETVECRGALGNLLAGGEQVYAGRWVEQREKVWGTDSESHCHSQDLALPEPCQFLARNHFLLFSFFMGSCRNPMNQVSGAVFSIALCMSLKPTSPVCPAFHFWLCTFPCLILALPLKGDCFMAYLGKPLRWGELRGCQLDLANHTFSAYYAWMLHCSPCWMKF